LAYTVEIEGTEKDFVSINYHKKLSDTPHTFSVELKEYESISVNEELVIKKDGTTVFTGTIEKTRPVHSPRKYSGIVLEGRDHLEKLERYTVGVGEDEDDPGTLVAGAISGTGINAGTIDSYGTDVTISCNRQSRLEYIKRIAQMVGWEYYLDLSDNLDFKEVVGSDLHASIQFETGTNAEVLKWDCDLLPVKNKIYAFGKGDSEDDRITLASPGYVINSSSVSSYGTREYAVTAKDITNRSDLTIFANSVLNRLKNPIYHYIIQITDTYAVNAYDVGDYVQLIDSTTGLNNSLRIYEITVDYSTSQGEVVELILSNRLPRIESIFKSQQTEDARVQSTPQSSGSSYGWQPILEFVTSFYHTAADIPQKTTSGGTVDTPRLLFMDANGNYCVMHEIWSKYVGSYAEVVGYNLQNITQNEGTYFSSTRTVTLNGSYTFTGFTAPKPLGTEIAGYYHPAYCVGSNNHLYWVPENMTASGQAEYSWKVYDLGDMTDFGSANWHPRSPTTIFDLQEAGLASSSGHSIFQVIYHQGDIYVTGEFDFDATYGILKITGESSYENLNSMPTLYGCVSDGINIIGYDYYNIYKIYLEDENHLKIDLLYSAYYILQQFLHGANFNYGHLFPDNQNNRILFNILHDKDSNPNGVAMSAIYQLNYS